MTSDCPVPVFVFPKSITFFLEDRSSHKQVLTIYNPYSYPVKYKILCTDSEKYIVNSPGGVIRSQHRADVVVRLKDARVSQCDTIDRFRVHILDKDKHTPLGKQDVNALLKSQTRSSRSNTPQNDGLEAMSGDQGPSGPYSTLPNKSSQNVAEPPNYVILAAAIVCIIGLLLPTEREGGPASQFQVSVTLKLIFAYVLGMVTLVILRTHQ